jgi:transposase
MVIQLTHQGMTTREVAKAARISLVDIGKIIRRYTGEETEYQRKTRLVTSKAFLMFKENKNRVDVLKYLRMKNV